MAKVKSTINWTPIIIGGGALVALYYLSRTNESGQTNLVSSTGDALSNLNPLKGAGWDWSQWGTSDATNTGAGQGDAGSGGGYDVTETNSLVPPSKVIQAGAQRTAGLLSRGYGASILTGKGMPMLWKSGQVASRTAGFRVASTKTFESLGTRLSAQAAEKAGVVASERAAIKTGQLAAERVGTRVAVKAAESGALRIGSRLATRAIPVVGWGLALADIGADIARVFGADMPEWLGFSTIPSAFTPSGDNIIESWARK